MGMQITYFDGVVMMGKLECDGAKWDMESQFAPLRMCYCVCPTLPKLQKLMYFIDPYKVCTFRCKIISWLNR